MNSYWGQWVLFLNDTIEHKKSDIHREFTSAKPGRLIIEKDRLVADNANKAYNYGIITLKNIKPEPKNPIIAKFFNNICRADELGSGVRNLYRDVRRYSAADPIFDEGDVFTLTVPLNDSIPAAGQESAPVGNEPPPPLEASTPQVTPQVEECTPPSKRGSQAYAIGAFFRRIEQQRSVGGIGVERSQGNARALCHSCARGRSY